MKNLIKVTTVSLVALTLLVGQVGSAMAGSYLSKNFRTHMKRAEATGAKKISTRSQIRKGKQVVRSNSKRQKNRYSQLSKNLKRVRTVTKIQPFARVIPTNPIPTLPPSTGPTMPTNPSPPPQVVGTPGDKPDGEVAHFLIGPIGKRIIIWAAKTVIMKAVPAAIDGATEVATGGDDAQKEGSQCEESSCEWKH